VAHLLARVSEETLLAHHALGVQAPAFGEIRGAERPADRAWMALGGDQVPVMPGIGLVHGGGRDRRIAVALEALLDVVVRSPIGRKRDKEMPAHRRREGGRAV